jgi:O-antigen/teichoic acid export membrane protein
MGSLIKKVITNPLLKSTIIYTVADSINKAIPFILLPVVARYLSTADYGVLTNFGVISQILLAICALNTYTALSVSYFKLDKDNLSKYVSNLFYLIAIITLICLSITTIFSEVIFKYLGITMLWQNLAVLSAFCASVFSLYTSLLRMQNKAFLFSGFQIFQSFMSAILALLFVVVLKWNWQGRVLSIVAAAVISFLWILWSMKKGGYIFKRADPIRLKEAFFFGLPLLPHTLSFWFKSGVDKIIITNYVSLSANGIFSIALTLGGLISVFTGAFFNAYTPAMFKDLSVIDTLLENEAILIKIKLVKVTYLFAILLFFVCLTSYFVMHLAIPILFKGDYLKAIEFMPYIMLSLFFDGMYSIVSGYIFYREKTKILGAITFISSMLQITFTLYFVRKFGVIGAAYSTCIVSFITFLSVFIYTNRIYSIPWGLKLSNNI